MIITRGFLILFFAFFAIILADYCDPIQFGSQEPIPPLDPNYKLKYVHFIVRHGARTPYGGYCGDDVSYDCSQNITHSEKPSMLNNNNLYNIRWMKDRQIYKGTCGAGVLTQLGYQQHLALGFAVRNHYRDFLPDTVSKKTFDSYFHVRSTHVPRVILSAESFLSGLYPDDKRNGPFEIKIETIDPTTENATPNPGFCPMVQVYRDLYDKSDEYVQHFQQVSYPLMQRVASALNIDISRVNIDYIADCWISRHCNRFDMPHGISPQLFNDVVKDTEWNYHALMNYPNKTAAMKAGIGSYLEDITLAIMEAINQPNQSNPRIFSLWAAHDTTIIPILNALDVWYQSIWPSYASFIAFEVVENKQTAEYYIRMTYNGKILMIPQCGNKAYCPLGKFLNILAQYFPTDKDCVPPTLASPILKAHDSSFRDL